MSEQPRLLFCCFDVVPGPFALSRRLTQYLVGLSEQFQVVVLSNKTPDHPHIEKYLGARLLRVPIGTADLPTQVQAFDRAVKRQLESEEYLVVHTFDPFGGYPVCEAKESLGYKVVYDATSFPSFDLPGRVPGIAEDRRFLARARRQELYCLMNAEAVIVGSQLTKQWVCSLGVEPAQVHVIRAPVDRAPYAPDVMGQPDATPMKIVHLGGLQDWHELTTLLEAMHLALQTCDVRLAIVGPRLPELMAPLLERVRTLKLTGKVEFQESVAHDDVHKILATADLGALTLKDCERNRAVGTPLARLAEYLAAGRPVVAANLPVARELVPEGAGLFYEPGDPRGLADALVALAGSPQRRVDMGAAARRGAVAFEAASARGELLVLYAQVTGLTELVAQAPAPEATGPTESTQVAFVGPEVTQSGKLTGPSSEREGTDPANARVPALAAELAEVAEGVTDPHANREAPPVMGTLVRDAQKAEPPEPTPIASRLDELAQPTDPAVGQGKSAPIVMGTPMRDEAPPAAAASSDEAGPKPEHTPPQPQPAFGPQAPVAPALPEHTPPEPLPAFAPQASTAHAPVPQRTPSEPSPAFTPAALVASPTPERTPAEPSPAFAPATLLSSPTPEPLAAFGPSSPLAPGAERAHTTGEPSDAVLAAAQPARASALSAPVAPAETAATMSNGMASAVPPGGGAPAFMATPPPRTPGPALQQTGGASSVASGSAPGVAPPPAASADSAVLSFLPPLDVAAIARGTTSPIEAPRSPPRGLTAPPGGGTSLPRAVLRSPPRGVFAASPGLGSSGGGDVPRSPPRGVTAPPPGLESSSGGDVRRAPPRSLAAPPSGPAATIAPPPAPAPAEPPIVPGVMAPAPGTGATLKLAVPPGFAPSPQGPGAGSSPTVRLTVPPGGLPSVPTPSPQPPPGASPTVRLEVPPGGLPLASRLESREPGIIAGVPIEAPPVLYRADERGSSPPAQSSTPSSAGLAPASPIGVGSGSSPMQTKSPASTVDEAEEISSDEVMEVAGAAEPDEVLNADDLQAQEVEAAAALPPPSALDPWHAQLVHGYCPPESNLFSRHTPPTTMPGRDH